MEAAQTEAAPRKLSLMELNDEHERIMAEVDAAEGEVTPEIAARLDAFNVDYPTKVAAYGLLIVTRSSSEKATDHVAKTFAARRDRLRRSVAALKKLLHESLEATGHKRVVTPTATVWIQANGQAALEITGEVPKEYTRTIVEPDLERIREKLEAGEELAFAKLVRGSHVRVG
jgi:hypothetical protein